MCSTPLSCNTKSPVDAERFQLKRLEIHTEASNILRELGTNITWKALKKRLKAKFDKKTIKTHKKVNDRRAS